MIDIVDFIERATEGHENVKNVIALASLKGLLYRVYSEMLNEELDTLHSQQISEPTSSGRMVDPTRSGET